MGSLGDGDDDELKPIVAASDVDFVETEVQDFGTQFYPPSFSGGKLEGHGADELQFDQDTMMFEDTVPVDEQFETQLLDIAGETQALDDADCLNNFDTQLIDEFDNEVVIDTDDEGTDRTEILNGVDLTSDGESFEKVCGHLKDGENMQSDSPIQKNKEIFVEATNALSNRQFTAGLDVSPTVPINQGTPEPKHGSAGRGFTFTRAASVRALGLVARDAFLRKTKSGPSATSSGSPYFKQCAADEISTRRGSPEVGTKVNQESHLGNKTENLKELGGRSKDTARKLFIEEDTSENEKSGNAYNHGSDWYKAFPCSNDLAGLSYIDSQEPGDASQANALEVVDKFIQVNVVEELDEEIHHGNLSREKSKPVSCAKGPQSLAKRASIRRTIEGGIFDFDDGREDEGGGELIYRRKKDLFDNICKGKKCFTGPRNPKYVSLTGHEKKPSITNKVMAVIHSDSRVLLDNLRDNEKKVSEAEKVVRKNLITELDEVVDPNPSDAVDVLNIGFDTQLAAEAMEALSSGACLTTNVVKRVSSRKRAQPSEPAVSRRNISKLKHTAPSSSKECSIPPKTLARKRDTEVNKSRLKRTKLSCGKYASIGMSADEVMLEGVPQGQERVVGSRHTDEIVRSECARDASDRKHHLQGEHCTSNPTVRQTTRRKMVRPTRAVESAYDDSKEEKDDLIEVTPLNKGKGGKGGRGSRPLKPEKPGKGISSVFSDLTGELENIKGSSSNHLGVPETETNQLEQSGVRSVSGIDTLCYLKGRRTRRTLSVQLKETDNLSAPPSTHQEQKGQSGMTTRSSKANPRSKIMQPHPKVLAASAEAPEENGSLEVSPGGACRPSDSACTTPACCMKPINRASPICMGNEYMKQSCKRSLSGPSLMKEIRSLSVAPLEHSPVLKTLRRRRDMTSIRVMFSQHLDDDICKQQKKILIRLRASIASSISDATHFVTDEFVRTRNMLEAIAYGKPVVTHLWLESCGQASCYIDEKNYILRDPKKEKEFGFSMPVSLARASQLPILKDRRVIITPNTKPGKEIIASLVRAVHGQVVETTGSSRKKDSSTSDDLLVLSCEEDYALCEPFLQRGVTVYSSELLLNGIVTQKLDYERHRIFVDCIKKTRSSMIWLKRDGNQFRPIARHK